MTRNIEIRKAGFTNKGAAMMLVAATQEVQARLPGSRVVVAANYSLPFEPRARLGLWHRAELIKGRIDIGRAVDLVPSKLRERYGFVTTAEIDVILDAAGFAYSDQWGLPASRDLAERSTVWKQKGKKLILLPQAFGPFKTPGIADLMKRVADNADLIFARERQSYDYLTAAVGERPNILIAPDFTNMLKAFPFSGFTRDAGHVAIVPNARMLDKTDGLESGGYERFLSRTISRLIGGGLQPFFLIHETTEDLKVAQRINASLPAPIKLIEAEDALMAKGMIAQCDAMVGSRFHALVSALSQGVPVLGTGWSHKYQELFGDYGYHEGLIRVDLDDAELDAALAPILSEPLRGKVSARLTAASATLKSAVSGMWDEVFRVIGR